MDKNLRNGIIIGTLIAFLGIGGGIFIANNKSIEESQTKNIYEKSTSNDKKGVEAIKEEDKSEDTKNENSETKTEVKENNESKSNKSTTSNNKTVTKVENNTSNKNNTQQQVIYPHEGLSQCQTCKGWFDYENGEMRYDWICWNCWNKTTESEEDKPIESEERCQYCGAKLYSWNQYGEVDMCKLCHERYFEIY